MWNTKNNIRLALLESGQKSTLSKNASQTSLLMSYKAIYDILEDICSSVITEIDSPISTKALQMGNLQVYVKLSHLWLGSFLSQLSPVPHKKNPFSGITCLHIKMYLRKRFANHESNHIACLVEGPLHLFQYCHTQVKFQLTKQKDGWHFICLTEILILL